MPRTPHAFLLMLVMGVAAACAGSPMSPNAPVSNMGDGAMLGAGDVFDVTVFGEKGLSGHYRIAEDGTIAFPLIGKVDAAGKTPAEVAQSIQTALRDGGFIKEPHVQVFVTEQISKRIIIMGAVSKPGAIGIVPGITVMQAISSAGGLTDVAAGDNTVVTRRIDGTLERFTVPVDSIIEGRADDFPLQSGDIIFVPERVF